MRAKVQGRFPFLGKMRNPGDTISSEELAQTTPMVRDALVAQKLIVLDGSDAESHDGQIAKLEERVAALEELVNSMLNDGQARRAVSGRR